MKGRVRPLEWNGPWIQIQSSLHTVLLELQLR